PRRGSPDLSPPSSVTDPGTGPPPSTRSSSASPVGTGSVASPSASATGTGVDGRTRPAPGCRGAATSSSTRGPLASQAEHQRAQFGASAPQAVHRKTVFTRAMAPHPTQGVGQRRVPGRSVAGTTDRRDVHMHLDGYGRRAVAAAVALALAWGCGSGGDDEGADGEARDPGAPATTAPAEPVPAEGAATCWTAPPG